ncbi:23S rRNA (pseudouridine(1915)-N(3))-methyltransferase RlmH [Paenibacillus polymyxa]|uniref:23S rRNA (pseudouridine(1915)-N(3))-methyltransferase RlmH n=1 Tax=Paenibacillus polymyxa TaxID=1406 RepID=UPI0039BD0247
MWSLRIFAVGEKLEKFYFEAIKEYEKRLSRYCNIQFVYLKKERSLQKNLNSGSFIVAFSTSGKKAPLPMTWHMH